MKKFLLLLPAFLLVGCGGAKNVSFKDNLKYDKPLNAKQLEEFDKNFAETSKTAKGMTIQSETQEMHGFVEEKTSGESTYTLYTNGSKVVTSGKIESKDNGVSYSTKENGTQNTWIIKKDGSSKAVNVSETSESEDVEINVGNYEEEQLGLGMFALALGLDPQNLGDLVLYQNGKEYAAVFSKEEKTVTDENPVLGLKKDLIETTNEQLVIEIGKDYKIKSGTYFYETGSNRDQDTHEWYRKVKASYTVKSSMKVTYGSLETRSENELYNILAKEEKEILISAKPLLKLGYYDGTSAKPAEASFTSQPEFNEVVINENKGNNTISFVGVFSLSANTNAFLSYLYSDAVYLTKDGFKSVTTTNYSHIYDVSNYFYEEFTSGTNTPPFMYKSLTGEAQFRLTFTLSIGENVSYSIGPRIQPAA